MKVAPSEAVTPAAEVDSDAMDGEGDGSGAQDGRRLRRWSNPSDGAVDIDMDERGPRLAGDTDRKGSASRCAGSCSPCCFRAELDERLDEREGRWCESCGESAATRLTNCVPSASTSGRSTAVEVDAANVSVDDGVASVADGVDAATASLDDETASVADEVDAASASLDGSRATLDEACGSPPYESLFFLMASVAGPGRKESFSTQLSSNASKPGIFFHADCGGCGCSFVSAFVGVVSRSPKLKGLGSRIRAGDDDAVRCFPITGVEERGSHCCDVLRCGCCKSKEFERDEEGEEGRDDWDLDCVAPS